MGIQVQTLYRKTASNMGAVHSHDYGNLVFGDPMSLMHRQFISFSFTPLDNPDDKKNIEDFNFVIVNRGDGLNKSLYPTFEDISKTYAELNGQQWYGMRYNANSLALRVGTDGIEDSELTEFLRYFRPGRQGWLTLSEHSNRKIIARIADAPEMEMVPYEKPIEFKVGNQKIRTSTTEYKGFVNLNFVMDYPFWEAIENFFDIDKTKDADELRLDYKVVYEDRIPILRDGKTPLSNNTEEEQLIIGFSDLRTISCYTDTFETAEYGKAFYGEMAPDNNNSIINNIKLGPGKSFKIYYAGTAPCYPKINFTINVNSDSFKNYDRDAASSSGVTASEKNAYNDYLNVINNNYTIKKYSSIQFDGEQLKFTLPGFLASYNEAVKILKNEPNKTDFPQLIEDIKTNVTDGYLCPIIIKLINEERVKVEDTQNYYTSTIGANIIDKLKDKIKGTYRFSIDCETGACTVTFNFNGKTITEYCGDMLLSRCVCINKRSEITEDGYIKIDSLIEVTSSIPIENFVVNYKYMYL